MHCLGAVSVWLTFPTVFVAWWSLVKLGQTITTWGFSQVHSDKWITTVVNPSFQRIETGKKRRMNEQKWKFRSISLVKVDKFQMCKKFCSLFNENIVSLFSRVAPFARLPFRWIPSKPSLMMSAHGGDDVSSNLGVYRKQQKWKQNLGSTNLYYTVTM